LDLALTNSYILSGYNFYNFGYIKLNRKEIVQLINLPIKYTLYRGKKNKVDDQYLIMRQLYVIFDEGIQWRYYY
jgi:hypothetical protein